MNQAFDAGFELNEGAVGHEAGDLATDLEIDGILLGDFVPRIFRHLFEAEGDAEAFLIDLENDDFDFLVGLQKFGRVTEATPGHIGDVEKAIETVEIDEGAEFGEIFDAAFDFGSLVEVGEEFGTFLIAFLFDEFAAGEDDVLAVFVEFYDAAFEGFAEELAEIFRRVDIDLGGGQESFDADIEHETTFDDIANDALDGFAGFAEFNNFVPVLFMGCFLAGEDDLTIFVFEAFEEDFDLLADGQIVRGAKFAEVDGALGFVADIDHDFARATFDDATFDDGTFLEVLHRLGQKSFEIGHMDFFLVERSRQRNLTAWQDGHETIGVLC